MKSSWLNSVLPIATIFSFRLLGLFMLIPIFTVYAPRLEGATDSLIGLALGGYGLSQGLLQIPFGMLSDRFGRKQMITIGLLLFACGSLFGALTHSITGMIFARLLQGTGAIGSVLIALLADLTTTQDRTKAMAVIGVTIGLSFSLAMAISPVIAHHYGLSGIFYLTAGLALFGLVILHGIIPTPAPTARGGQNATRFKQVLQDRNLQRLNLGIFCQHLILTATFYVIPLLLQQQISVGHLTQSWHFYLPLMVAAFLLMVPFIMLAEKKHRMKTIFLGAVAITGATQLILAFTYPHWLSICIMMFIYFVAFNVLEASLPSLVSKQATADRKGTAMGIYSSCQFLGIFAGGALAGVMYQFTGTMGIFIMNAMVALLWLFFSKFINTTPSTLT